MEQYTGSGPDLDPRVDPDVDPGEDPGTGPDGDPGAGEAGAARAAVADARRVAGSAAAQHWAWPLPVASEPQERALFDLFAGIAARQPAHLAVDDGTESLSYRALHDRALALGARVSALVPAGSVICIAVPTSALYPVAWLACLSARRAFVPLDPSAPPARNLAIIAEARPAAVLVPAVTARPDWLPAALPRIGMDLLDGPDPVPPALAGAPAAVGLVLFTSGSTGRPKGIALHERAELRRAHDYRAGCAIGPSDGLLSLHPVSTAAGAGDTFAALLSGASLHPLDLKRRGLAGALEAMGDSRITLCAGVPVVARALVAMHGAAAAMSGLRLFRMAGDTVMSSDIAALGRVLPPRAQVMISFGMTESGASVAQRLIDPHAPIEAGRLAVGQPLPGQTITVEDAAGRHVGPGETGELVVRGRYVAVGHWVGGRLDAAGFPADPHAAGGRVYRTGDLVRLRPDGMLLPIGRADRQAKINGVRVEPGETEAALRGLAGVADAVVLVHGAATAAMLVAFVVPASEGNAAPEPRRFAARLRRALVALLPPSQVPQRLLVVDAIPLLPSLKPDHAALRGLLAARPGVGVLGVGALGAGVLGRLWRRLRPGRPRPVDPPAVPASGDPA